MAKGIVQNKEYSGFSGKELFIKWAIVYRVLLIVVLYSLLQ